MTVIVAHDTPDAIRGMLKRWFIEPSPNVFVGTLNRRTHEKTLEYIRRNAAGIGLLIVNSREILSRRGCKGSSDSAAAYRDISPPSEAPITSTSVVQTESADGQAASTVSIIFRRHSALLSQNLIPT